MIKTFLLAVGMLINLSLFSQDTFLRWAKHLQEQTGQEVGGRSIKVDNAGNVYTAGIFFGNTDFDPGVGSFLMNAAGQADIFISKLDANGNFVWAKSIGGLYYDNVDKISFDNEGNILITGFFNGTVDFDPGSAVFNMSGTNSNDIFFAKLDAQGIFIWAKKISTDRNDYGRGIDVDASGNIYITGFCSSSGAIDFDPGPNEFLIQPSCQSGLFILKLDPSGNFVWVKAFQGCNNTAEGYDLVLDNSGSVYLAGNFHGTIDFDPGPGIFNLSAVTMGSPDMVVLKLDTDGNFIWAKAVGKDLGASSLFLTNTGSIYITGAFHAQADFDPGPGTFTLTPTDYSDCFILKLDNTGNFIWAKQLGGINNEGGNKIKVDGAGNVYTLGQFSGMVDFDPGPGTFNIAANGFYDLFLSKLDINGGFLWAKSIGNTGLDNGLALFVDNFKNIYMSGTFESTVDFDPELPVYNLSAVKYGGFVMKLGQCNNSSSSVISVTSCSAYTLNGHIYQTSGTYIQTILNSAGCDSIITLNLTINNRYTMLNVSACDSYTWNGQSYTSSGIYKDTLLTTLGCDSIITLDLVVNKSVLSTLNAAICSGQNYYGYTTAGTYTDVFAAANGCDSTRILSLSVKPISFTTIDTAICQGQNYHGHKKAGTYTDMFIAANGCDSVRTLNLAIKNNCGIHIPNAFTPNGDSRNDVFKPTINQGIQSFSFIIFNRYGEKVFETKDYTKSWDGTFKGKAQPAGSYVYFIKFTDPRGWESENKGTVLLIR